MTALLKVSKGIIIGCNAKLEYLLPYFYLNLRLNSDLPIIFYDFGMSVMGRNFCEKRGEVIKIENSLWKNKNLTTKQVIKTMWFKKPLACQKAPFDINLWLDIDCKILNNFDSIFNFLREDDQLAIYRELRPDLQLPLYNSGVIIFRKNASILSDWITLSKQLAPKKRGDQDVLSELLNTGSYRFSILPNIYNCLMSFERLLPCDGCIIHHYIGSMKAFLQKEYLILERSEHQLPFENAWIEY